MTTKASKADVDAATALAKKIARTSEYINHGGFIPTVAEAFAEVRESIYDEVLDALHKRLPYPTEACAIVRSLKSKPAASGE